MMTQKEYLSQSTEETLEFASRLAKQLKPGSVIGLVGDLGSGKTTFIKGIAHGLGLANADEVKSPTFVLMHIYKTTIPLYHFDLYRLESAEDFQAIGFEEFTADSKAISCIEWADKAGSLLPAHTVFVHLEHLGLDRRRIIIIPRHSAKPY
ncbi:MAG: tRNA (adenosine(37)-N6)-threonylcarbamoyltransferase complex ATPase subunit type 1 TsaE [Candidatus Omnitrophica bacterium]|nr:tRNA (adenosine(37)-N6)-threonylcarbamoyltransferase complex ATPase subunit type 1 TsaE [Candidatus Omnitrophota bacterium]